MKRRILVVEDHDDSRDALVMLLSILDYDVEEAATGADALAKVREGQHDVVLLDLSLPDVSGYDVARAICEGPGDRPFVIALSGYGRPVDRSDAADAGCDAFLLKPAEITDLEALLTNPHVGRRRSA